MLLKKIEKHLSEKTYKWLVTGCAGFIGSHLIEFLLKNNQIVVGLDDLSTGFEKNIQEVINLTGNKSYENFKFYKQSITDFESCELAVKGVDFVLHQAALGSVPRSIDNPMATNDVNVGGFVNILTASKNAGVKKFVFASSSSVYGDNKDSYKSEESIGKQLSPYAISKYVNELYAENFSKVYGINCVGLRYFNVFGPRQNPEGAYAAVVPKWIGKILEGAECQIFGSGETSRDFTYITNVVIANIAVALNGVEGFQTVSDQRKLINGSKLFEIYNVACGATTSLNQLKYLIIKKFAEIKGEEFAKEIVFNYKEERKGDVRHSLADINKIKCEIGFEPVVAIEEGISETVMSYVPNEVHSVTN